MRQGRDHLLTIGERGHSCREFMNRAPQDISQYLADSAWPAAVRSDGKAVRDWLAIIGNGLALRVYFSITILPPRAKMATAVLLGALCHWVNCIITDAHINEFRFERMVLHMGSAGLTHADAATCVHFQQPGQELRCNLGRVVLAQMLLRGVALPDVDLHNLMIHVFPLERA